jgi:hypothetical protein
MLSSLSFFFFSTTHPMPSNDSDRSAGIRQAYLDAFDASPSSVRTALLSPRSVNGVRSPWYGVVGAEQLGYSDIPTIG